MRLPLPRRADVALGAALGLAEAGELVVREAPHLLGAMLLGLACGVALMWRQVEPLASAVGVFATLGLIGLLVPDWGNTSVVVIPLYLVSLYSLGAHATGWQRWAGLAVVAVLVVQFALTNGGGFSTGDVVVALAWVGLPWAAGLAIGFRRERERSLAAENTRLAREQEEAAQRAVASERARIARELHDVVAHAIAVTVLQARGGRAMLGNDDDAVRRALDAIEQTNTKALDDMRRLLAVLRDTEDDHADSPGRDPSGRLAPQPSLANLDDLIEQVRSSGLRVDVEVADTVGVVPPGIDLSAYRIIQEALTNTLKHAGPAARATVRVVYDAEAVDIWVCDDGLGTAAVNGRGHGLLGIRERVAVVGGSIEAAPRSSGGFEVHARLPTMGSTERWPV